MNYDIVSLHNHKILMSNKNLSQGVPNNFTNSDYILPIIMLVEYFC